MLTYRARTQFHSFLTSPWALQNESPFFLKKDSQGFLTYETSARNIVHPRDEKDTSRTYSPLTGHPPDDR